MKKRLQRRNFSRATACWKIAFRTSRALEFSEQRCLGVEKLHTEAYAYYWPTQAGLCPLIFSVQKELCFSVPQICLSAGWFSWLFLTNGTGIYRNLKARIGPFIGDGLGSHKIGLCDTQWLKKWRRGRVGLFGSLRVSDQVMVLGLVFLVVLAFSSSTRSPSLLKNFCGFLPDCVFAHDSWR